MPLDPQEVQRWANGVMRSPYWAEVKSRTREQFVRELVEAAHDGDHHAIARCSWQLSALDKLVLSLKAIGSDTRTPRVMHEVVVDDAE